MEPSPGIEPGFPPYRSGVLPLDDDGVESEGIEPSPLRCGRSMLPLSTRPRTRERNRTSVSGASDRRSAVELLACGAPGGNRTPFSRVSAERIDQLCYRGKSACDGSRTRSHPMDSRVAGRWRSQANGSAARDSNPHHALIGRGPFRWTNGGGETGVPCGNRTRVWRFCGPLPCRLATEPGSRGRNRTCTARLTAERATITPP